MIGHYIVSATISKVIIPLDESNLPVILSFHAVHCDYEIHAIAIPIPVKKENGKTVIQNMTCDT
jgi:hypothetical protein